MQTDVKNDESFVDNKERNGVSNQLTTTEKTLLNLVGVAEVNGFDFNKWYVCRFGRYPGKLKAIKKIVAAEMVGPLLDDKEFVDAATRRVK